MLFNQTTEAGLYWPGFYTVDTTTRGKAWIKLFRENKSKKTYESKEKRNEVTPTLKEIDNKTMTGFGIGAWIGSGMMSSDIVVKKKKRISKTSNSWNLSPS